MVTDLKSIRMCAGVVIALLIHAFAGAQEINFEREVRPILGEKCFRCHGPDEAARQSGLRLDDRDAALTPADSGQAAIVAGKAEESELVRRISSSDPDEMMPPPDSKLELTAQQKDTLIRWIAEGAQYQQHWSLTAPRRSSLPTVKNTSWPRNEIDQFVLARLEAESLEPSQPADRYQLVRRLYLDLTGLPPTPAEADAFVNSTAPDAYEQLVDRLLSSPAFGERMVWPWLDAARYADSNGYQGDAERTMWPWRDWAIGALNRNLSFDQFSIWQIAGDRLPDATFEQKLATGFCRNHMINGEGGRIPEENRVEYVMDMSETVATVWLGLTLNCCRCHDHKFDPLLRRDYYSMFAFFNQTPVDGGNGNPQCPPAIEAPTAQQQLELTKANNELTAIVDTIAEQEKNLCNRNAAEGQAPPSSALPEAITQILAVAARDRSNEQLDQLQKHFETASPEYVVQLRQLREARDRQSAIQNAIPRVMVMEDQSQDRPTFMLEKGLYNRPGDEVTANVPVRLPPLPDDRRDRLALAQWLVSPENPLTARVTVNRYWQLFFGAGLVKTTEDFGTQGELPSHPQLLDWLAVEFRESGWDVKHLCRLIVCSATYQQSSQVRPALYEHDPENRLLARGSRFRLPSWMIRDQALQASGLLVAKAGGAPVHPYQPEGIWEDATFGTKSYPQDHGQNLYRRSVYAFWRRIVAPTFFFDVASRQTCTVKQSRTNTPLQALTTLNDITYVEAARVLAEDVLSSASGESSAEQLIHQMFRRILVRPPRDEELRILVDMLSNLELEFRQDAQATDKLLSVGQSARRPNLDSVRLAALTALANALMNIDEALTKE